MRTVHKYPFPIQDSFELRLPVGFDPVLVDVQGGAACLWAEIDDTVAMQTVQFAVTGTGDPVPRGALHVSSFQQPPFVWHLWRVG